MVKNNVSLWGLLIIIMLVRLLFSIVLPFADTTEARYAEIARIMAGSGDWITPWFNDGIPFWGKPPLSFWLQAISFNIFGFSEFAGRFPSWPDLFRAGAQSGEPSAASGAGAAVHSHRAGAERLDALVGRGADGAWCWRRDQLGRKSKTRPAPQACRRILNVRRHHRCHASLWRNIQYADTSCQWFVVLHRGEQILISSFNPNRVSRITGIAV
mgnify:CR=1 FL=1